MKAILVGCALIVLASNPADAFPRYSYHAPKILKYTGATTYHRGSVNKNGVYSAPHFQTSPNSTKADNWSSKPNVNPFTGKKGTVGPYRVNGSGH